MKRKVTFELSKIERSEEEASGETRRQAARRGVDEEACMHTYEETEIQYEVSTRAGVNKPPPGGRATVFT